SPPPVRSARVTNELFINLRHFGGERWPGEAFTGHFASCIGHAPAEWGIMEQSAYGQRECGGVVGRDEDAGDVVDDGFDDPAGARADDGEAAGHRFDGGDAESFGAAVAID